VTALRTLAGRPRRTRADQLAEPRLAATGLPTASTPAAPAASPVVRAGMHLLVTVIGLLLAGVIAAPIALSSQDIVAWAGAPDGLGLAAPWDVFTFVALDAAAAVCVGMVVYAAWRGEPAGAFGLLVWLFAAASAYANYQHGTRPGAPGDAWWFFPAMSIAGPALLEVTVRRIRRWVQTSAGRYERPLPHFRLARWLVALPETAVAWRLAVTEGYSRPEDAITAARLLRQGAVVAAGPPPAVSHAVSPSSPSGLKPTPNATPGRTGQATADATRDTTGEATGEATSDATRRAPRRATPSRHPRRRPAAGVATARLEQAYGDGLDPATGRPWTSRPLGEAADVHHATAAAHLRKRRTASAQPTDPPLDTPTDLPAAAPDAAEAVPNGHRPEDPEDRARPLVLTPAAGPAPAEQPTTGITGIGTTDNGR
jgi:hypothetical protein